METFIDKCWSVVYVLLIVCVFDLVNCQGWVIEDEDGCRTPDRNIGECVLVRKCRPMLELLQKTPRPFSPYVRDRIGAYTCGFEGNEAKVCCPSSPILIRDPNVPNRPPSAPDVTNHRNFRLLPPDCGYLDLTDKIVNGENANLNEFPWMALISYNTKRRGPQFKCGGSILNDRYILTAAHCIKDTKDPLLGVRVGEHDMSTRIDCERQVDNSTKCTNPYQDLAIEEVVAHPGFDLTALGNDIGLLRVSKMNLTVENARPVCLPVDPETRDAKFNNTVVTGWGFTNSLGATTNILQKVELPVFENEDCARKYAAQTRITHKQLCAGGKKSRDSCGGDSGGPLQVPAYINDETRYVQQGIVSFGSVECGQEGSPGVYTRVAYYMDWILDNIKP